MSFPESFLWGGALSASQAEGGYQENHKGLSIADMLISGNQNQPRQFCSQIKKDSFYWYKKVIETNGERGLEL